ncbi:hypothetical protein K2X33_03550 [bacterium]|nr:hypothetical protein [bacterium]
MTKRLFLLALATTALVGCGKTLIEFPKDGLITREQLPKGTYEISAIEVSVEATGPGAKAEYFFRQTMKNPGDPDNADKVHNVQNSGDLNTKLAFTYQPIAEFNLPFEIRDGNPTSAKRYGISWLGGRNNGWRWWWRPDQNGANLPALFENAPSVRHYRAKMAEKTSDERGAIRLEDGKPVLYVQYNIPSSSDKLMNNVVVKLVYTKKK